LCKKAGKRSGRETNNRPGSRATAPGEQRCTDVILGCGRIWMMMMMMMLQRRFYLSSYVPAPPLKANGY